MLHGFRHAENRWRKITSCLLSPLKRSEIHFMNSTVSFEKKGCYTYPSEVFENHSHHCDYFPSVWIHSLFLFFSSFEGIDFAKISTDDYSRVLLTGKEKKSSDCQVVATPQGVVWSAIYFLEVSIASWQNIMGLFSVTSENLLALQYHTVGVEQNNFSTGKLMSSTEADVLGLSEVAFCNNIS